MRQPLMNVLGQGRHLDQFAFHTFLLAPDTDLSTFTTGRAPCGQLIVNIIYSLVLTHTLGAKKKRIIETVLLSAHNFCFG